jgi:hypothetical protein
VELVLAIRSSMHETVRAQHSIIALFSALTKFFTYKQKEDMTNGEFLKGFKEHRDVFKTQWGTKITDEYAERLPEYATLKVVEGFKSSREIVKVKFMFILRAINYNCAQPETFTTPHSPESISY